MMEYCLLCCVYSLVSVILQWLNTERNPVFDYRKAWHCFFYFYGIWSPWFGRCGDLQLKQHNEKDTHSLPAACGWGLQLQCLWKNSPHPISTGHARVTSSCLLPYLAGRGCLYLTREENGGKESQTAAVDRRIPTLLSLVSKHLSSHFFVIHMWRMFKLCVLAGSARTDERNIKEAWFMCVLCVWLGIRK